MTLPDKYKLVHVTEKETIDFTRAQNGASWHGALTLDQYVTREWVLSKGKVVSKLMVFVLVDSTSNEKLALIEVLIRHATKYSYDGQVQRTPVTCACIGGVFTYPQHRGKGLARTMVDKLMHEAKTNIIGHTGFTFLYSEIGEYYSRNGFVSFPVPMTFIPVAQKQTTVSNDTVEYIGYHEFEPYFKIYRERYERSIEEKLTQDHRTRVSANITLDYVDWFHLRSKYISYHLFHQKPAIEFIDASYEELAEKFKTITPKIFGLKIVDGDKLAAFIVWTYDWATANDGSAANVVTVIRIHVEPGYDVDDYTMRVLTSLKKFLEQQNEEGEPATTGFVNIKVWDSDTLEVVREQLQRKFTAEVGIDNPSRSAIHIHDPQDHQKLHDGQLLWENNNKLTWF